MKFGKQANGGGTAEQTMEQTQAWGRLVKRFEKNGGVGVELDFPAKVVGIKHPHEVSFTKDGKRIVVNYGYETPEADRFKVNDKGKTVPMQPGCLLTYELTEPRFAGLRFYKEGTFSGNEKTPLYKTGNAIYRGKLDDLDVDPDQDFIDRPLLVTIRMDAPHDRTTVDGSPVKGGYWWKVVGFKSIPVADDDDEEEDGPVVVAPAKAPARPRELVGAGKAKADLFDDEEAPF